MRAALSLLALPLAVQAAPAVVARDDSKVPYLIDENCKGSEGHYEYLIEAAREAEHMLKTAVKEWWDEGKHREIAARYLAIPDEDNFKDNKHAQLAHDFLARGSHLFGGIPFLASYIHFSCADPKGLCVGDNDDNGRPVKASTKDNEVYVCNHFWGEANTAGQFNKYKEVEKLDKSFVTLKGLQGTYTRSFIHEIFHTSLITQDRPHPIDQLYNGGRAYGADVISEWVTEYKAKPETVLSNADSFAIFVIAIDWKNKFGYLPPPSRENTLHDKLECYNNGDSLTYFSRDVGIEHVTEFCENVEANYNVGTTTRVERTYEEGKAEETRWTFASDSKGIKSKEEIFDKCKQAMGELIDNCDTSTRFKTGGGFNWASNEHTEYEFQINPVRDRPYPKGTVEGKCDVWYKFFYDEFYIYGGAWAGHDHGQSQLLPNLRRCGVVSEWEFEYYDEADEHNHEWKAYGRIPIGAQQWNCVRQAVVDAGGPSDIGCGGR